MGLEVTTKMTCDVCHKNLKIKLQEIRGRRSTWYRLTGVYLVSIEANADVTVQHDPEKGEVQQGDGSMLCCSHKCVGAAVLHLMPASDEEFKNQKDAEDLAR